MASIQAKWSPADGRDMTIVFPTATMENYEAKIDVVVTQDESGDPKYPRNYRPPAQIKFKCSSDDIRDLIRTLERLI